MLKYTHKDNPNFTFLFLDDPLNAYYKLLRKLNKDGINTESDTKKKKDDSSQKNEYTGDEKEPICPYAAPGPAEKVVIDKMAPFVFQHGARFELTVRERENNNNIFEFLKPFSKYHAFYKWRIGLLRQKFTIDKDALDKGLAESSDPLITQFRDIAEIVKVEEQEAKKKEIEDQIKKDKLKKSNNMNIKSESETPNIKKDPILNLHIHEDHIHVHHLVQGLVLALDHQDHTHVLGHHFHVQDLVQYLLIQENDVYQCGVIDHLKDTGTKKCIYKVMMKK